MPLQGKGNVDEAKRHFQSLRLAKPEIKGLCILDRDADDGVSIRGMPEGMSVRTWNRYEIENYLLIPELLKRFVRQDQEPLFCQTDERRIDDEFAANFPARVDYLGDLAALRDLKASDFIVGLMSQTSRPLAKRDLYMLAALSRPDEIHPDVVAMLGAIAEIVPPRVPSIEANVTPPNANGVDTDVETSDLA